MNGDITIEARWHRRSAYIYLQ